MVIEHLTFHVPPCLFERFVREDARVWTGMLARQPGFEGKEVWRETGQPERVHIIIWWLSETDWHAVPRDLLIETELAFTEAMGTICPVLSCSDYECAVPFTVGPVGRVPSASAPT